MKYIYFLFIWMVVWIPPTTVFAEGFQTPLAGKVIVIDPGHGGIDGGATRKNITEKDVTLLISKMLRDYLQPQGALVILTREGDYDLAEKDSKERVRRRKAIDLSRRVEMVQKYEPDIFISIHLNAIPHAASRGAQTFYYPAVKENKVLATSIQKELISCLKNTDRLARPIHHVYLLKHIQVPSALVEAGFVSNANERAMLGEERYQKKIAAAIYHGVLHYLNKVEKNHL